MLVEDRSIIVHHVGFVEVVVIVRLGAIDWDVTASSDAKVKVDVVVVGTVAVAINLDASGIHHRVAAVVSPIGGR